jgi:hypothetical protein
MAMPLAAAPYRASGLVPWHKADVTGLADDICLWGQSGRGNVAHAWRDGRHPMPACKIVAVTLPPALDNAFMVNRIAATGVENVA